MSGLPAPKTTMLTMRLYLVRACGRKLRQQWRGQRESGRSQGQQQPVHRSRVPRVAAGSEGASQSQGRCSRLASPNRSRWVSSGSDVMAGCEAEWAQRMVCGIVGVSSEAPVPLQVLWAEAIGFIRDKWDPPVSLFGAKQGSMMAPTAAGVDGRSSSQSAAGPSAATAGRVPSLLQLCARRAMASFSPGTMSRAGLPEVSY